MCQPDAKHQKLGKLHHTFVLNIGPCPLFLTPLFFDKEQNDC